MKQRDITTWIEVELLVDTDTKRRIAGLRHGGSRRRQLLFRAGELYADLQILRPPGSTKLVLAGQLVGSDLPGSFSNLPLELDYEDGTLLRARTNELGEFLLTCPPRGRATLEVALDESIGLAIPIPADVLRVEEQD